MSQSSALIVLGLITFLAPFSGLPYSLLNILIPLFGIAILAIGLSMRAKKVRDMAANMPEAPASSTSYETTSNIG